MSTKRQVAKKKRCDWIIKKGYSKGRRCGNDAEHNLYSANYCYVHFGKATKLKGGK